MIFDRKQLSRPIFWHSLALFLIVASVINTYDLRAYTLQHAVVESVVERGTFAVGLSQTPRLRHIGDVYVYNERLLPAKLPGQFIVSSIPYSVLRYIFGLRYLDDYDLVAALVALFSGGILVILAAAAIFQFFNRDLNFGLNASLVAATTFSLGSTIFAYSSVPHHEVMASCLIAILVRRLYFAQVNKYAGFLTGLLMGAVGCLSTLSALVIFPFALWRLITDRMRIPIIIGAILGISPLLAYNFVYHGDPFLLAHIAGNYKDTFFWFDGARTIERSNFYLGLGALSLLTYSPICWLGLVTTLFGIDKLDGYRTCARSSCLLLLFYIFNIDTIGHSQYGPRYLIPLIPLCAMSVGSLYHTLTIRRFSRWLELSLIVVLAYSIIVQLVGAIGGTMYSDIARYAPIKLLSNPWHFKEIHYPLMLPGLSILALVLAQYLKVQRLQILKPIRARWWILLPALLIGLAYAFSHPKFHSPYDYTIRVALGFLELHVGLLSEPPSWLNEFVLQDGKYQSVFPLGAVLSALPFAMLKYFEIIKSNPSFLVVAIIAGSTFLLTAKILEYYKTSTVSAWYLLVFMVFGNWHWVNLIFGGSWQIAIGWAVVGQLGAIWVALSGGSALLMGAFFALAFGNRTEIIICAPLILALWWRSNLISRIRSSEYLQLIRELLKFSVVPVTLAIATAWYNWIRFGSIFDFGYARIPGVLDEPWYQDGIFALSSLWRNANQMLFAGWKIVREYPYLTPTGFGGSILLSSPILISIFRRPIKWGVITFVSWIAVLILTAVLWLHGNPGGWQYSYRYAAILLPWLLLLILESSGPTINRWQKMLIAIGVLINSYAIYLFYWTNYVQP